MGKGADSSNEPSNLRIAAIALAGLNFDKNTMWRTQCNNALSQISDPHLRGLFAFLTAEYDNYEKVLVRYIFVFFIFFYYFNYFVYRKMVKYYK